MPICSFSVDEAFIFFKMKNKTKQNKKNEQNSAGHLTTKQVAGPELHQK